MYLQLIYITCGVSQICGDAARDRVASVDHPAYEKKAIVTL